MAGNILEYVSGWQPGPSRKALYVGEPAGQEHLEQAGIEAVAPSDGGNLTPEQVLIVGPGGGQKLAAHAAAVSAWLKAGGNLLAIGVDEAEANAFLPFKVAMKKAEHIAAYFEPPGMGSLLAGVGPADVHDRDAQQLPLVVGGAAVIGDGVLAKAENANVVFCQMTPWSFDYPKQNHLKRTYRRSSYLVDAPAGQHGRRRRNAAPRQVQQSRGPGQGGEALAGRPVPGCAGGDGTIRTASSAGRRQGEKQKTA